MGLSLLERAYGAPGDEALRHRFVEQRDKRLPEAIHVQKAARPLVYAQLRPREHLAELLQRPVGAGQRDEAVREVRHQFLALVHRADDVEFGEACMGDLPRNQRLGYHADDFAALFERRVG